MLESAKAAAGQTVSVATDAAAAAAVAVASSEDYLLCLHHDNWSAGRLE